MFKHETILIMVYFFCAFEGVGRARGDRYAMEEQEVAGGVGLFNIIAL